MCSMLYESSYLLESVSTVLNTDCIPAHPTYKNAIFPLRKSEKTVASLPPSKLFFPFALSLTPIDKKTFPHFLGLRGYPSIIHNSNICAFFAPCQSLSFY